MAGSLLPSLSALSCLVYKKGILDSLSKYVVGAWRVPGLVPGAERYGQARSLLQWLSIQWTVLLCSRLEEIRVTDIGPRTQESCVE